MSVQRLPRSAQLPLAVLVVLTATWALAACAPAAPPPPTAAELARGGYLVDHVVDCLSCHSQRDWSAYSGPIVAGTEATGGTVGLFGSARVAPPITAEALGPLSIGHLAAQIRGEVALDPPIHNDQRLADLAALTPADARAIAAYLQAGRPAVEEAVAVASSEPWAGRPVDAGRYLVTIARCRLCHGEDLAGGLAIGIPFGPSLPSANLTPDANGIAGRMGRDELIAYFKSLDAPELAYIPVPEGESNTAMPWPSLSGMREDDLGAIFDYLRTLPPVATPDPPGE